MTEALAKSNPQSPYSSQVIYYSSTKKGESQGEKMSRTRWKKWRRQGPRGAAEAMVGCKAHYQAFFWVLIDLIVELLVLIIKPFDNQTESW
jgi:hypothetical protein